MRFASIDPFISPAERTQTGFDVLHQPERGATLLPPGAPADQAFQAEPGQGFVELGWFLDAHITPSGESLSRNGHQRSAACRPARLGRVGRPEFFGVHPERWFSYRWLQYILFVPQVKLDWQERAARI